MTDGHESTNTVITAKSFQETVLPLFISNVFNCQQLPSDGNKGKVNKLRFNARNWTLLDPWCTEEGIFTLHDNIITRPLTHEETYFEWRLQNSGWHFQAMCVTKGILLIRPTPTPFLTKNNNVNGTEKLFKVKTNLCPLYHHRPSFDAWNYFQLNLNSSIFCSILPALCDKIDPNQPI